MVCRLIRVVFVISLLAIIRSGNGYKWLALKSGDPIPRSAIKLNDRTNKYVGRVNYYNVILPAEVASEGARAYHLSNFIEKNEFEVLVDTEHCKWELSPKTMENVVRAGTAWDGEPIYIGRTDQRDSHVVSIYLTSNKHESWSDHYRRHDSLICNASNEWVDASPENIPSNTIKYKNVTIARLLGPSSFVPGEVLPKYNTAWAEYKQHNLLSSSYQVLVGDSNEYIWKEAIGGEIPDYAFAAGQAENKELLYVTKFDRHVTSFVFSEFRNTRLKYELLVKNVE